MSKILGILSVGLLAGGLGWNYQVSNAAGAGGPGLCCCGEVCECDNCECVDCAPGACECAPCECCK